MQTRGPEAKTVAPSKGGVLPQPDPRRRHYGAFYGLDEPPPNAGLVLGNCQAESLRIVIDGAAGDTVRIPPVHELEADDLPHLDALLADSSFVVLQPVRDDYRGLPLGTSQIVSRLAPGCRVVKVPPVRFNGLHPAWSPLHVEGVAGDPPYAAYHDVRTLARVAGLPLAERLDPETVRAIADDAVSELRRREERDDTVVISDLFGRVDFTLMRTPNHPANPVLLAMAERILDRLGVDAAPTDPGRPLLSSVEAPRDDWVIEAWGLDEAPRPSWLIGGEEVAADVVAVAQEAWYRENPGFVAPALERLGSLVARWRAA